MNNEVIIQRLSDIAVRCGAQMDIDVTTVSMSNIKIEEIPNIQIAIADNGKGMTFSYFIGETQISSTATVTCLAASIDSGFDYSRTFNSIYESVLEDCISAEEAIETMRELAATDWAGNKISLHVVMPHALGFDVTAYNVRFNKIANTVSVGTSMMVQGIDNGIRLFADRPENIRSVYRLCIEENMRVIFRGLAVNDRLQSDEMNIICTLHGWGDLDNLFEIITLDLNSGRSFINPDDCRTLALELLQHYRTQTPAYRYVFDIRQKSEADIPRYIDTYEQACTKYGKSNVGVEAIMGVPFISENAAIAELASQVRDTSKMLLQHFTLSHTWSANDAYNLMEFWSAIAPAYWAGEHITFTFGPAKQNTARSLDII